MSDGTLYDAIRNAGYAAPEHIEWDGQLHRFATDPDKRHSKDGWYVAHDDAKGKAAAFGSWRDGATQTWSNGTGRQLTKDELADIEAKKRKSLAEEKKAREQAALRAQRLYDEADQGVLSSGYLQRKGIQCPDGVRAVNGLSSKAFGFSGDEWTISGLLVPMRDRTGTLKSLQIIPDDAQRNKLFMKGGQTAACYHSLGDIDGAQRLLIGEGLATAQSAREATGCTALVAFSAGNLPDVAGLARALNATAEIIILGDDDEAGRLKSAQAAQRCGGRTVFPGDGCNDFNDLHAAHGLEAVRAAILGNAQSPAATAVDDVSWRADLIVKHKDDGSQTIPCRVHNLIVILSGSPDFSGRIRYNEFSSQIAVDGNDIDDVEPIKIKAKIEKGLIADKIPTGDLLEAMSVVASRSSFHPVREYLDSLRWDGTERIPFFFDDYCGCVRDDYHIAVAQSLFVSSVARIFKPGCKVDTMVILQSAQGMRKTMLWLALYGQWCMEVTASLSDKDFYSGLRGVWCADFSELDAFSRSETTQIKRILTSQSDSYRPHYGRGTKVFPRQCVFVGGTNKDDWNTDATGGRRFLPVQVAHKIDVDSVATNRDQLWAEAVVRYRRGETWWDIPDAHVHQEATYQGDPWEDPIMDFVLGRSQTSVYDVLLDCLRIDKGKQTRADQMRVSAVLKRHGWERKKLSSGKWVYVKKE